MAFTPFSAKNARVRIGGAVFTAKAWVVTPKTDKIDTTNAEGNGFGDAIGGIIEAEISIDDSDWDGQANPYDNPPNLQPTQVVALRLYLNATAAAPAVNGPFWNFAQALVLEVPTSARVREAVKLPSIKLYGKGQFTYPTGAAA